MPDGAGRVMTSRDWRLPENRREGFQRLYSHHLRHRTHPGCVYYLLPAIADAYDLSEDQRAWLVWLTGNTQNVVTSMMLLEAAPTPSLWRQAVSFWADNYELLEWDTDRRHQKSQFGPATHALMSDWRGADGWAGAGLIGWDAVWAYAVNQPFMGRLSAWSMTEYARILLGSETVPDASSFLLGDVSGSRSHRNGLAVIAGHDAWSWEAPRALREVGLLRLEALAEDLLAEARRRNPDNKDVSRLTMESALCTYKSHYKVNRRYPNVYNDMMYYRIRRAEARFDRHFDLLWEIRQRSLPRHLLLEQQPFDPGLRPEKQNHFRLTGEFPLLGYEWDDMEPSGFDLDVRAGTYGRRKDPKWTR